MDGSFSPAVEPPNVPEGPSWWYAIQEYHLLVHTNQGSAYPLYLTDLREVALDHGAPHFLGTLDGDHCYAVEIPAGVDPPAGMTFESLRSLYGAMPEDLYSVAGRAVQIVEWDRNHQYCGRCGSPAVQAPGARAKKCPECGLMNFPRLSPAVIVLVQRGDEILLARSRNFPDAFYSVLAGFVEPGETLEETVAREVYEESGIELHNIRYFGSQPWPFPHSLMIGFTAEYAGGEIRLEDPEILDAAWFRADNLPRIPGKISIARRLIDWFVDQKSERDHSAT